MYGRFGGEMGLVFTLWNLKALFSIEDKFKISNNLGLST